MSAIRKGKARADVDRANPAGKDSQREDLSQQVKRSGKNGKTEQPLYRIHSQVANQAGPSSSSRRQVFSPPSDSNSEDEDEADEDEEDDLQDSELQHESEDEFEQYRSGTAPSYAQYVGDSEMEDDSGESDSEDEDGAHSENEGEGSGNDSDDGQNYLKNVQAGMLLSSHKLPCHALTLWLPRPTADSTRDPHQSSEEA